MKLFGWYREGTRETLPLFAGVQGSEYQHTLEQSQQAFDRALLVLKRYSKYMLDISPNAYEIWSRELKRYGN